MSNLFFRPGYLSNSYKSSSLSSLSSLSSSSTTGEKERCDTSYVSSNELDLSKLRDNFKFNRKTRSYIKAYESDKKKYNDNNCSTFIEPKTSFFSSSNSTKQNKKTKKNIEKCKKIKENRSKNLGYALSRISKKFKLRSQHYASKIKNKPKLKYITKLACYLKALTNTLSSDKCKISNEKRVTIDKLITDYTNKLSKYKPIYKELGISYIKFLLLNRENVHVVLKNIQKIDENFAKVLEDIINSLGECSE
jgi:hypothetical protein